MSATTTTATAKIEKQVKGKSAFSDRYSFLNCFLTGNGKQVTILNSESWRKQSFATYENFVMINEEMGEEAIWHLQEQGYDQQFYIGDIAFLAKTRIEYTRFLATGDALDGDIEAIPVHKAAWYLDGMYGEIRADWEKQFDIFSTAE